MPTYAFENKPEAPTWTTGCPGPEILIAAREGRLDPAALRPLHAHLHTSDDCFRAVQTLSATKPDTKE